MHKVIHFCNIIFEFVIPLKELQQELIPTQWVES